MYLSILGKQQKRLFLEFAYHLAVADGNYSEEEQIVMKSYCDEMHMEFALKEDRSVEDIVSEMIEKCDMREKRIIIFEAIGLAMSDNKYDESEKILIHSTMLKFGIKLEYDEMCEKVITEYFEFQKRINQLVLE